jgi:stress-induced morphogen
MPGVVMGELEALLQQAFPEAQEVRVTDRTGGGDHFLVEVTSPRFDGLPLLDQHKLVNAALAGPFAAGTIHEMRIKTRGTS